MMNLIDTSPGASPAARAVHDENGASEAGSADGSMQASAATGDSIAYGASAYGDARAAALAYLPLARGGTQRGAESQSVALFSDAHEGLAARFGPQIALIRAALPAALQAQFVAQMMAASETASGDESAARSAGSVVSEHDLVTLVAAGAAGNDDVSARALVSRLSHDVARYGSAAVAQALQLAHERSVFAAAGEPPVTRPDARERRPGDERERRQRQHERRPAPEERSDASPPGDGGHAIYTIEDVVRFGDETIATHRMPSPLSNLERTAL